MYNQSNRPKNKVSRQKELEEKGMNHWLEQTFNSITTMTPVTTTTIHDTSSFSLRPPPCPSSLQPQPLQSSVCFPPLKGQCPSRRPVTSLLCDDSYCYHYREAKLPPPAAAVYQPVSSNFPGPPATATATTTPTTMATTTVEPQKQHYRPPDDVSSEKEGKGNQQQQQQPSGRNDQEYHEENGKGVKNANERGQPNSVNFEISSYHNVVASLDAIVTNLEETEQTESDDPDDDDDQQSHCSSDAVSLSLLSMDSTFLEAVESMARFRQETKRLPSLADPAQLPSPPTPSLAIVAAAARTLTHARPSRSTSCRFPRGKESSSNDNKTFCNAKLCPRSPDLEWGTLVAATAIHTNVSPSSASRTTSSSSLVWVDSIPLTHHVLHCESCHKSLSVQKLFTIVYQCPNCQQWGPASSVARAWRTSRNHPATASVEPLRPGEDNRGPRGCVVDDKSSG